MEPFESGYWHIGTKQLITAAAKHIANRSKKAINQWYKFQNQYGWDKSSMTRCVFVPISDHVMLFCQFEMNSNAIIFRKWNMKEQYW